MAEIHTKAAEIKADKKKLISTPFYAPAGQSTQMIIGATPTPDQDILKTSGELYKKYQLRRVYYSAFSPIPHADKRLPLQSPPLVREHRLYQADWMLRFYGYDVNDITLDEAPDLPLHVDPKTAWALRNQWYFPIDVNTAAREQLLRIPGMGVQSVQRILKIRRYQKIRFEDLIRMRVAVSRAKYFVITADHNTAVKQLDNVHLLSQFQPQPQQIILL